MTDPTPGNGETKPSLDQLVDLLVYAPIGLLYEYPEVMDRLVKRGRSQAQLAKVMTQMAARQGTSGAQQGVDAAVADLARAMARCVTEVGVRVGLAPEPTVDEPAPPPAPTTAAAPAQRTAPAKETAPAPLPVAGYDDLKARDIVPLLGELDPDELSRIEAHELAHRRRKTVLGKISTLLAE